MAVISTDRLADALKNRVGQLHVEIIMRDVAIAELEDRVAALEAENAELRNAPALSA